MGSHKTNYEKPIMLGKVKGKKKTTNSKVIGLDNDGSEFTIRNMKGQVGDTSSWGRSMWLLRVDTNLIAHIYNKHDRIPGNSSEDGL